MSKTMNKDKLQDLANELAKDLKNPQDLSDLSAQLTKMTVEAALNAEMDYFLDKEEGNSRNGYNRKQLKGEHGQFELNTPRDRQSKFEPQLVKKRQTRITGMDDQIMALYAKGMSTRDIVDTFEEMYGVDISPALVSQVTNSIMECQVILVLLIYFSRQMSCMALERHTSLWLHHFAYITLVISL